MTLISNIHTAESRDVRNIITFSYINDIIDTSPIVNLLANILWSLRIYNFVWTQIQKY